MRQLFTVIRALADFPFVTYLLAFDREVAAAAINEQTGLPGERYLGPGRNHGQVLAVKVFLDDEGDTPAGWVRVYWPSEAIALLETGRVSEISLDHDLGDDARGTGYDVVLWIEEAVALRGFTPPRMSVHSANASAAIKMKAGIRAIAQLLAARDDVL